MSGIRPPNISLFRNASQARKNNIMHTGGDIFIASSQPSDMAVLWGELFGSKERKFLRELLQTETVCFSLKDTYQIHVRKLFHPISYSSGMNIQNGLRRAGNFALLLHDLKGELTTSWTWAKFIRPLYRKGYSVICVDLPGYGKSSVAKSCSCPLSAWQAQEAHVVSKILEELGVARCQIIAHGRACGILIRAMESAPHRIATEHVLINPIFDRMTLFAHVGIDPPPGAAAGWQDVIKAKQQNYFINLLRTSGVRLWCIFDRDGKYRSGHGEGPPKWATTKELHAEWQMAADTHEMLVMASQNEFLSANLKVTEVTRNDLCQAHAGKKVPVSLLVPSRHLKASIARFLACFERKPWELLFMPNHVAFQKGKTRTAQYQNALGSTECLAEDRFSNDSDESDLESEISRQGPKGLQANRAIELWHEAGATQEAAAAVSALHDKSRDEFVRPGDASEALEAKRRDAENIEARHKEQRSRQLAKLSRSASDAGLNNTRSSVGRHTLSHASSIAAAKLKKTGAIGVGCILSAETQKDMKSMNWTKVPFEQDLSFGVRKMYLDAFEASVETFKDESEAEYERQRAFQARAGFRGRLG